MAQAREPMAQRLAHGQSVVLGVFALVVSLVLGGEPARAAIGTPWTCDSAPKYYCATVLYEPGSPATGVDRRYKGYIGSSTAVTWWKIWWLQDWVCSPYPSCTWLRNYGEGPEISTPGWTAFSMPWNPTMTQQALVNFKLKFREPDGRGGDYIFCSPQLDHYLWDNTSDQLGGSSC